MRHVAVIGSGPAGYYSAEALQKHYGDEVRVDMIDRMPVPYGLIRFGVAPDHQSIKAVYRRYEKVALSDNVRFVGNVLVGRDVSIAELLELYDAVILATGAPDDRPLDIPGGDLPGVIGSAAFVGWYNGHPEFADLDPPLDVAAAAVIGNGNVALDVARILAKTPAEFAGSDIVAHAFGALGNSAIRDDPRARPARAAPDRDDAQGAGRARPSRGGGAARSISADFPPVLDDALLEPGPAQVGHPSARVRQPRRRQAQDDRLRFLRQAGADRGRRQGRAADRREDPARRARARAVGTGETYAIDCGLVVTCIGYKTPPIEGVPYEEDRGRFANARRRDRRRPLLRRLGAARADRHDRHQPARRL